MSNNNSNLFTRGQRVLLRRNGGRDMITCVYHRPDSLPRFHLVVPLRAHANSTFNSVHTETLLSVHENDLSAIVADTGKLPPATGSEQNAV